MNLCAAEHQQGLQALLAGLRLMHVLLHQVLLNPFLQLLLLQGVVAVVVVVLLLQLLLLQAPGVLAG